MLGHCNFSSTRLVSVAPAQQQQATLASTSTQLRQTFKSVRQTEASASPNDLPDREVGKELMRIFEPRPREIRVVFNPVPSQLREIGFDEWEERTIEVSKFDEFSDTFMVAYILDGVAECEAETGGATYVRKDTVVTFPKKVTVKWDVQSTIKMKFKNFDYDFEEYDPSLKPMPPT